MRCRNSHLFKNRKANQSSAEPAFGPFPTLAARASCQFVVYFNVKSSHMLYLPRYSRLRPRYVEEIVEEPGPIRVSSAPLELLCVDLQAIRVSYVPNILPFDFRTCHCVPSRK